MDHHVIGMLVYVQQDSVLQKVKQKNYWKDIGSW
jgi:hypothetical protein